MHQNRIHRRWQAIPTDFSGVGVYPGNYPWLSTNVKRLGSGDGLKVLVDQMSEMYLDGISIDYIETLEGAGFKFNNPNVKSTCGCGSSFTV